MSVSKVQVYYGEGRGKTSAAMGCAIHKVCHEGTVVIIEFLKRKDVDDIHFLQRLEPELKIFRFQKADKYYDELDEADQFEEQMNMKNGLHYARKVLLTGECSTLILDEVLGLVDHNIISVDDLIQLLDVRSAETDVILTGRVLPEALLEYATDVYEICSRKEENV